jgi:hypothetical protein
MILAADHPAASTARIHGNGFLQIDLLDGSRLHLWDDRLPRQAVNSAIHNHRFGFISEVLRGTIINTELAWVPAASNGDGRATHALYRTERRAGTEDTHLVDTGHRGTFVATKSHIVHAGNRYRFPAARFHTTHHLGLTVTRLHKRHIDETVAVIAALRLGEQPDNEFNRDTAPIPGWVWSVVAPYLTAAPAELPVAA